MVPNVLLLAIQKYSTPLTVASAFDIGAFMVNVFPVSPESCCPPLYHVMTGAGTPDTSHVSVNPIGVSPASTAETTRSSRGELKEGGVPVGGGGVEAAVS